MGDPELVEEGGTVMSVGERLREAREAAGLTLEDIATSTRIPTRHLESLEASDFSRLPAPTYTIGFAKNFAGAVGLDRAEIGEQLRAEMGGTRPVTSTPSEVFEPADPARAMPKSLIIGTIVALLLAALLFNWLSNRSLEAGDDEVAATNAAVPAPAPVQEAPQEQGPVVITATDQVWLSIKDGATTLKEGVLEAGQSFAVPATATAPLLTTGKPEALRISVGSTIAPPIGPPATTVTDVSLKGEDLLRPAPATAAVEPGPAPPQATPVRAEPSRRASPPRPAATRPASPPTAEPSANEPAPESNTQ